MRVSTKASQLIPLGSVDGRKMFRDLALSGALNAYFPLISHRIPQSDSRRQGVTTLTTVLNALGIDPERVWKWPWRWYADSMIHLENVGKPLGLEEFSALARRHKAATDAVFPLRDEQQSAVKNLRSNISTTSSAPSKSFVVAAYRRHALEGGEEDARNQFTHFSMLGGYHAGSDSVLLLDVYPPGASPVWTPALRLHSAMSCKEDELGGLGGWVTLRKM